MATGDTTYAGSSFQDESTHLASLTPPNGFAPAPRTDSTATHIQYILDTSNSGLNAYSHLERTFLGQNFSEHQRAVDSGQATTSVRTYEVTLSREPSRTSRFGCPELSAWRKSETAKQPDEIGPVLRFCVARRFSRCRLLFRFFGSQRNAFAYGAAMR
jgi:hypothetical protein